MLGEFRMVLYIITGGSIALAAVFSVPALTESTSTGVIGEDTKATMQEESDHCKANLNGVDCACYGRVAGYVRSDNTPQARGFRYANKTDLARNQASTDC